MFERKLLSGRGHTLQKEGIHQSRGNERRQSIQVFCYGQHEMTLFRFTSKLRIFKILCVHFNSKSCWIEKTRKKSWKCNYLSLFINWAPSSEFVCSSIPSWQIVTAHAQPFRGARDLAFCLKVPLDSLLVWASSGGSGETARMRRLAWTFTARIGD